MLLPGTGMTLSSAGAPHSTLVAIVVLAAVAAVTVGPSFALLFSLHGRQVLHAGDGHAVTASGDQPGAGLPGPQRGSPGQPSAASRAAALAMAAAVAVVRALDRRRRKRWRDRRRRR